MYKSKSTNEVYHTFKFLSTVLNFKKFIDLYFVSVFLKILYILKGRALKIKKIEIHILKKQMKKKRAGKTPCQNYSSSFPPSPYSPPAL